MFGCLASSPLYSQPCPDSTQLNYTTHKICRTNCLSQLLKQTRPKQGESYLRAGTQSELLCVRNFRLYLCPTPSLILLVCFVTAVFEVRVLRLHLQPYSSSDRETHNLPRSLIFRHRASCILGQTFHYSPENAFYIFNQQTYYII